MSKSDEGTNNKEFREMLKDLGFTHERLAKYIRVHRNTVTKWFAKKGKPPRIAVLLLKTLKVRRELTLLKFDELDRMQVELREGKKTGRFSESIELKDIPENKRMIEFLNRFDEVMKKFP